MTRKRQRLYFVLAGMAALGVAAALVLSAFEDSLVYFYSPSDLLADKAPAGRSVRLGGLVEEGTLVRADGGLTVNFRVTDTAQSIPVSYTGILPDLFREGQGVVAEGEFGAGGVFQAREVLAKHDENYMPPEVADAIKRAGQWKPEDGAE